MRGAVDRARIDPAYVDGVYMGSVLQAGLGMAPARQAMLHAGLPDHVPAATINKVCGSGLMAVALAAQQIMLGEADVIVAGGMESMSNAPHLFPGLRSGQKAGDATLRDGMILDGLWSPWDDEHVGYSAEAIAKRDRVSREAQDSWALRSHQRAIAAMDGGAFRDEIVPVSIPGKRGGPPLLIDTDECPRRDTWRVQTQRWLRNGCLKRQFQPSTACLTRLAPSSPTTTCSNSMRRMPPRWSPTAGRYFGMRTE
ncbi:MAG: hypothetical protein EB107_05840 [Proteobacteria bacterium]|nr:hypothetical protein [Pseudomonadota bacterium]